MLEKIQLWHMWSVETHTPKKTKLKIGQEAADENGGCSSYLTWFALVWILEFGLSAISSWSRGL